MGDKWTTSGGNRIKAKQNRTFDLRCSRNNQTHLLMKTNVIPQKHKSAGFQRRRNGGVRGGYSTNADPLARRAIAPPDTSFDKIEIHPVHSSRIIYNYRRRIREPVQRCQTLPINCFQNESDGTQLVTPLNQLHPSHVIPSSLVQHSDSSHPYETQHPFFEDRAFVRSNHDQCRWTALQPHSQKIFSDFPLKDSIGGISRFRNNRSNISRSTESSAQSAIFFPSLGHNSTVLNQNGVPTEQVFDFDIIDSPPRKTSVYENVPSPSLFGYSANNHFDATTDFDRMNPPYIDHSTQSQTQHHENVNNIYMHDCDWATPSDVNRLHMTNDDNGDQAQYDTFFIGNMVEFQNSSNNKTDTGIARFKSYDRKPIKYTEDEKHNVLLDMPNESSPFSYINNCSFPKRKAAPKPVVSSIYLDENINGDIDGRSTSFEKKLPPKDTKQSETRDFPFTRRRKPFVGPCRIRFFNEGIEVDLENRPLSNQKL